MFLEAKALATMPQKPLQIKHPWFDSHQLPHQKMHN